MTFFYHPCDGVKTQKLGYRIKVLLIHFLVFIEYLKWKMLFRIIKLIIIFFKIV